MARYKQFRSARQGCLSAHAEMAGAYTHAETERMRTDNHDALASRRRAARLLARGDTVRTEEGRIGKVGFINLKSGSVDVQCPGERTKPYAADSLTKL